MHNKNMRSNFASLCALLLAVAVGTAPARAGDAPPPNIIHIIVDDLGWNDVGFHGSEIRTPAIDRLAGESVVLDRFYVAPICSPTRAGVLTGRYPFRFGIWGGVVSPLERHGMPPAEQTAPELLAAAGYRHRALLGKWHLGLASTMFHPLRHGFTQFYGHYNGAIDYFRRERFGQLDWHRDYDSAHEDGYSTDLLGAAAAEFIDARAGESPFYLVVAFNAPHSPLQATRAALDRNGFDPAGPRAPNRDRAVAQREHAPNYGRGGKGNTIRQTYAAMVSTLDDNVDRILQAVERNGVADNTLVILHSDNGGIPAHGGSNKPLRGTKFTTWEGGVRVVAMLRWPAQLEGGSKYESVAGYIDVLPTLLAAAGQELPANLDGINLLPYLQGQQPPPDRAILLGADAVVSDRWKLKDGEAFDLQSDPHETAPVADPPAEAIAQLQTQRDEFATLSGPKTASRLPLPENWPPREWKLPEEPQTPAASSGGNGR